MNSEDFSFEVINDVVIEKIHFTRATMKEATIFKSRLDKYLFYKHYKIIVDLSDCEFIDSTFLGVLVVSLKKIFERGGEIKFVITSESLLKTIKDIKLDRVFNLYNNRQAALDSFKDFV